MDHFQGKQPLIPGAYAATMKAPFGALFFFRFTAG
jgi:hypothetical protein